MTTLTLDLSQQFEDKLVDQLAAKGMVCVENAVDPASLEACREEVQALLKIHGQRFFSIVNVWKERGGAFADIVKAPGFVDLLRNIVRRSHSAKAADFELYNVLRVIGGEEAKKGAFEFHYDATVLTVLMPLYIPTEGEPGTRGELLAQPNQRGYRKLGLVNFLEKLVLQSPLAFKYYARKYAHERDQVVELKPGNLYFFNGYRTFHGNLPCKTGQLRATLIFHFGDPHAGDPISRMILKLRQSREKKRLHG